ncbi:hypothetical protein HHX47_DHR7000356 [Lentinula edodes]|nr:hypothetical protein HHX47_DHR7000356 [Lentinula edodes]
MEWNELGSKLDTDPTPDPIVRELEAQVNEATSSAFAPEFLAKRSQNHLDELEVRVDQLTTSLQV